MCTLAPSPLAPGRHPRRADGGGLRRRPRGPSLPDMSSPSPSPSSAYGARGQHAAAPLPAPDGAPGAAARAVESDAHLLRRMAAGDEGALGLLHDRWSPLLLSLVYQIVGNDDDAEEVLEETFWQAWRQAGRYEESRAAVSTWLTMMARSRALDRVRARRRSREESWDELPEVSGADPLADGTAASPLAATEEAERREIVLRAVAQLPAEQRQAVELAYFRGMSQTEIAEATGQPLGTVKTRVRLAMQKLRGTLAVLREDGR